MKKTVEILWTGGYDSSFRMCQLSRKDVIIQPYYLSDNRASEENELKAINVISDKLRSHKDTVAEIKELIYVPVGDRKQIPEITQAFKNLLSQDRMGSQYEWLGIFALEHKGIEMSIHKDDKAVNLIQKHGKFKLDSDETGEWYVIDTDASSEDCSVLFGNLRFPLVNYTKLEMKSEYEAMGLEDVINDTWFCFTPIDGKPCGCCNPCKYTIEEGMAYRFSDSALKRYKWRKTAVYRYLTGLKRRLKRLKKK